MCAYRKPPSKGLPPLDRKPPKNEKYAHVQGRLDTGPTIDKVKFITNKECARRRDEIFYRITKSQLHELYCEYEQEEREDIIDAGSSNYGGPRIVNYSEDSTPSYTKPYIIFDCRELEEYQEGHLMQARSYPFTMMRRDRIHPELYNFRNKEGHLVIVYCNDESISQEAATLLVQRGTDNVYLLSGGVFEFGVDFSTFIEGIIPIPVPKTTKRSGSTSTISTSRLSTGDATSRGTASIRGPVGLTAARLGAAQAANTRGGGSGVASLATGRVPGTSRLGGMSSRRDDRSESAMTNASGGMERNEASQI